MNLKFIEYCIIEKAIVKLIEEVMFITEVKLFIAEGVVLVSRVSSHDYGRKVLGNIRQFFYRYFSATNIVCSVFLVNFWLIFLGTQLCRL